AVRAVSICSSLDEVMAEIEVQEGKKPLCIATSARTIPHDHSLSFYDQETVWQEGRPVIFVIGTGKGLSDRLIANCDFLLDPIEGFSAFNHLSVRSACAILFDRWLGIMSKK
ncbi:MAG TPA: RNA methyltransferase, partial [Candidatus Bathyarchaeia archaeon]|nr:RNA methyltransferase [Candidatus Bathyarchaeia archaeon]